MNINYKAKIYPIICPSCNKERLVTYKQKWNIQNDFGSGKCLKCSYPHCGNFKKGITPWNKGKEFYQIKGKNNCNWKGGKSFEIYPPTFNQQLKDRIRVRDNFICQICGVPELECNRRLDIHHKDYNKMNINPDNLISLCQDCHNKTNYNREYWKQYFNTKNEVLSNGK